VDPRCSTDGKILAAGWTDTDFALLRYDPTGTLDPTFGTDGVVITRFEGVWSFASGMAIQDDGKIVLAGWAFPESYYPTSAVLARYNSDGGLDHAFGTDGLVMRISTRRTPELWRSASRRMAKS